MIDRNGKIVTIGVDNYQDYIAVRKGVNSKYNVRETYTVFDNTTGQKITIK